MKSYEKIQEKIYHKFVVFSVVYPRLLMTVLSLWGSFVGVHSLLGWVYHLHVLLNSSLAYVHTHYSQKIFSFTFDLWSYSFTDTCFFKLLLPTNVWNYLSTTSWGLRSCEHQCLFLYINAVHLLVDITLFLNPCGTMLKYKQINMACS